MTTLRILLSTVAGLRRLFVTAYGNPIHARPCQRRPRRRWQIPLRVRACRIRPKVTRNWGEPCGRSGRIEVWRTTSAGALDTCDPKMARCTSAAARTVPVDFAR